jgi:hypothetical protein
MNVLYLAFCGGEKKRDRLLHILRRGEMIITKRLLVATTKNALREPIVLS